MISKLVNKYTYKIEWSEEDNLHIASCLEFSSLMAHGVTIEKALEEIKNAVAETIEWLQEDNEEIPIPFSFKKSKKNITLINE